jgi:hypothetical protein
MELVEFENSSLHTRAPEGMLGAKFCEATPLFESPGASAMALTVRLDATRNGAS